MVSCNPVLFYSFASGWPAMETPRRNIGVRSGIRGHGSRRNARSCRVRYARSRCVRSSRTTGDRRRSSGCSGCSEGQSQEQRGTAVEARRLRRRRAGAATAGRGLPEQLRGFGEDAVGMEGNQELIAGLALEAREAGPRKGSEFRWYRSRWVM